MARVILVTGGSRSGKSRHALTLAESLPGPRAFVATCPPLDDEMRERIRKHRAARRDAAWQTIEEPTDLARVLGASAEFEVVLVDCLTLWVGNLMHEADERGEQMGEDEIEQCCRAVLEACAKRSGAVLFVTNEVGMGIVPENALARRFRDLAGRCNQMVAAAADEVILMVCGIPQPLK